VDAVGDLAQVGQRLTSLLLQHGQLRLVELAALEPVPGQPQPRDERDDVLLDAVVEVAFDAAALVILGGDEPDPGRGQLAEPLLELGGQGHVGHRRGRLLGDRGQELQLVRGIRAAPLWPHLNPPDPPASRGQLPDLRRWPGHGTGPAVQHLRPLPRLVEQADARPRGAEPVPDRGGELVEDVFEPGGPLELHAELDE
jgi:hypothetical protein